MSFRSWLQNLRSVLAPRRGKRQRRRRHSLRTAAHQLNLEALEDRCLLSFTPVASYAGGTALAADFNNDNVPDLVRNAGSVLLGNGDGTFTPAPGPAVYGTAVGDLDGDGNLDLVGGSGPDVTVLMGTGDGTFTAGSSITVEDPDGWVAGVAVGDFNGDGNLDLAATSSIYHSFYDPYYGGFYGYYTSSAHVLLGDGSGGFSGPNSTALEGAWQPGAKFAADFNGDGFDDLMTSEGLLLGDGTGVLQNPLYDNGDSSAMAFADVDGDLDTDMVTTDFWGGVHVRLWNGSTQDYATGSYQTSVALADFNGDGALDIVTTSNIWSYPNYSGQLNVLLGYGDGTFAPASTQDLDTGFTWGPNAGDFDGDGLADLVVSSNESGSYQSTVLLNAGGWNVPTTVAISDATAVTEGDSGTVDAVFTVTRKGNLGTTVTVPYWTGGGDATAGKDYVAQTGTLTFGPNETTKTIKIKVKGDLIDEYNQVFVVHLNDVPGAITTDRDGICAILDNDPPPTITITPKVSAKEGHTGTNLFKFFVTLSAPSEKEVWVNFATLNGTASTADNDYVANSGSLVFALGQTSKTISVVVKGDRKKESNESFLVNLTNSTNATIVGSQGIGEILNDD